MKKTVLMLHLALCILGIECKVSEIHGTYVGFDDFLPSQSNIVILGSSKQQLIDSLSKYRIDFSRYEDDEYPSDKFEEFQFDMYFKDSTISKIVYQLTFPYVPDDTDAILDHVNIYIKTDSTISTYNSIISHIENRHPSPQCIFADSTQRVYHIPLTRGDTAVESIRYTRSYGTIYFEVGFMN